MASLALLRGDWAARPWRRARLAVMEWRVLAGMQASDSAAPGVGIYAGGGNAPPGGLAGDGIVAWPGSGTTDNPNSGLAGYFGGTVNVNANLAKAGGSFVIDHPTDPANKYLYHSFVESPGYAGSGKIQPAGGCGPRDRLPCQRCCSAFDRAGHSRTGKCYLAGATPQNGVAFTQRGKLLPKPTGCEDKKLIPRRSLWNACRPSPCFRSPTSAPTRTTSTLATALPKRF